MCFAVASVRYRPILPQSNDNDLHPTQRNAFGDGKRGPREQTHVQALARVMQRCIKIMDSVPGFRYRFGEDSCFLLSTLCKREPRIDTAVVRRAHELLMSLDIVWEPCKARWCEKIMDLPHGSLEDAGPSISEVMLYKATSQFTTVTKCMVNNYLEGDEQAVPKAQEFLASRRAQLMRPLKVDEHGFVRESDGNIHKAYCVCHLVMISNGYGTQPWHKSMDEANRSWIRQILHRWITDLQSRSQRKGGVHVRANFEIFFEMCAMYVALCHSPEQVPEFLWHYNDELLRDSRDIEANVDALESKVNPFYPQLGGRNPWGRGWRGVQWHFTDVHSNIIGAMFLLEMAILELRLQRKPRQSGNPAS